jgi:hypothetical protein
MLSKLLAFLLNSAFLLGLSYSSSMSQTPEIEYQEESIFHFSASAGFLVSQIQGDLLGGYHKIGGTFGIASRIDLPRDFKFLVEINYVQLGSSANKNEFNQGIQKVASDYLSIPVLANYQIKDFSFSAGLAIATLIRFKVIDGGGADISSAARANMRPINIINILDINYHFNEHWIASVRSQISLTSAVKKNQTPWRHNGLNFLLSYIF